ncbi:unnamed protein product, partial [Eretmochelys imbricata]
AGAPVTVRGGIGAPGCGGQCRGPSDCEGGGLGPQAVGGSAGAPVTVRGGIGAPGWGGQCRGPSHCGSRPWQDLVAWVTVGFLHIPHAEDVPNTATPGNAVGFFLRPFNFFDEDPSVASRSTVIVRPRDPAAAQVEIQRWTPAQPGALRLRRALPLQRHLLAGV